MMARWRERLLKVLGLPHTVLRSLDSTNIRCRLRMVSEPLKDQKWPISNWSWCQGQEFTKLPPKSVRDPSTTSDSRPANRLLASQQISLSLDLANISQTPTRSCKAAQVTQSKANIIWERLYRLIRMEATKKFQRASTFNGPVLARINQTCIQSMLQRQQDLHRRSDKAWKRKAQIKYLLPMPIMVTLKMLWCRQHQSLDLELQNDLSVKTPGECLALGLTSQNSYLELSLKVNLLQSAILSLPQATSLLLVLAHTLLRSILIILRLLVPRLATPLETLKKTWRKSLQTTHPLISITPKLSQTQLHSHLGLASVTLFPWVICKLQHLTPIT